MSQLGEIGDDFEPVVIRRGRLEDSEMDMSSMIDLTFLLLIFFMVASRIATKPTVVTPEARYGDVIGEEDAVILTVNAVGNAPQIYLGSALDSASLVPAGSQEEQEARVADYVKDELQKGKKHVLILAARGLKHRDVSRVAQAAGRAEIDRLHIGVTEKK